MNKRFFGLHFDFHAKNDVEIGLRTNAEDIQWYIQEARPDFVQCDCKGHEGNSSYFTKVGKPADKLKVDNLKIWCDTVHKAGLPIYMHYSGVIDDEYTLAHPEEAQVDENGNVTNKISLFGNYAKDLLIPQIKELIREYGVDGIWVDGDCWAVARDYSEKAKPHLPENVTVEEHNRIMREAYLRYLKQYVDELHAFAPGFKVASNWAYTSYIPEKPEVNLDFLSGDYPHNNSVHSARYEGRCIAAQNMPWDLMSWSFEFTRWTEKPAIQLQQEAAMVLSLGGGFQLYVTQNQDGSIRKTKSNKFRQLGDFVHARRFLFEKQPIAQVAVLYSASSYYCHSSIFNASGATEALIGTLNCVLDAQYTANIILEYQLDQLATYQIVIVPQWDQMAAEVKDKLIQYANNGGNLVIVGADCCQQLGQMVGKTFDKVRQFRKVPRNETLPLKETLYLMDDQGNFAGMGTDLVDLEQGADHIYFNNDLRDDYVPAYRIEEWGSGKMAFIPFDLGDVYFTTRTPAAYEYLKKVLECLKAPFVKINRKNIDISLQMDTDGLILNLINMRQGRHSLDVLVYDEIPEVYGVEVVVSGCWNDVTLPCGEAYRCEYGDGYVKIFLEKLEVHTPIRLQGTI